MKRIKTFLRSTMNPERLNALTVLSMEKNFFNSHPEIKKKIITFSRKVKHEEWILFLNEWIKLEL
jgi:hypothetical protein